MILALSTLIVSLGHAAVTDYDAAAISARELLGELVAADTTNPPGNEAKAAAIAAKRLEADGIASTKDVFGEGRENLVARLKGSGKEKPLLLLAHLDVVGASGQAWTSPPHTLTEKDGYLVGRGSHDDLGMAAVALEVLRLLKREKTPLRRDVILALTGDEESGGLGIQHLLAHDKAAVDAGVAINEGGGLVLDETGKVAFAEVQVGEKTYQDFTLVAKGETGHSSVPRADNAIYRLAGALEKLSRTPPPVRLPAATRAYFRGRAAVEKPKLAAAMRAVADNDTPPKEALAALEADPVTSASLRTTCVATMLTGGTRVNALPAEATANVNCRILPDETIEQTRAWLAGVLDDPKIEIRFAKEFGSAGASPTDGEAMAAIQKTLGRLYPGVPVVPSVSRGATDSRFLRAAGIPSYGLHPIATTEADSARAHGVDERIPVEWVRRGVELLHRLVLELASESRP